MELSNVSLKEAGTEEVSRERLMRMVSTFSKARWQVLKMDAGMGSRLQDLMGDSVINFITVSRETTSKEERETGEEGLVKDTGWGMCPQH